MSALGGWWRRLVLLFTRDQAMRDLEDEMRLHREMRAEANRAAGADGDEAEEAARHRFGNAAALGDASRDEWGWRSFDELAQDVRYAARRLRQRPGFTFGVCAVLALGIGATTAVFSAVDAAMLRPLPFDQPERLIATSVDVPFSPGAL
ncbi:MAG TPA: permease prefix domain 1-containing protein, partial [Gemmatimonadaceae bacterium]|nr:permease prefix domain 1-containing protein [Gemmatimonadaceae bacterium]